MKKFMALMMSMMLVLSLAACGDTEEVAGDAAPVESVAEDVAESVEEEAVVDTDVEEEIASEEEADTISSLWDLANAEIPDLAGTTWGFTGGCMDGVEMEQEDLILLWKCMVEVLTWYLLRMAPYRWYRVQVPGMVLMSMQRMVLPWM